MAENGGKDDGSDLEDDEPVGPGGDNSTAHKGMSLKGKEEWKDVSLPRISGSGQSLGSVGEVGKQTDGPTRSVGGKHTGNGNGNGSSSRARARTPIEVKGKTREMNVYPASSSGLGSGSSSGSGNNLASQPQQGSTSLASSALGIGSRTVTGSWTGQGGYQDDRVYERSEPGFQDDRNGGYHERASLVRGACVTRNTSPTRADGYWDGTLVFAGPVLPSTQAAVHVLALSTTDRFSPRSARP